MIEMTEFTETYRKWHTENNGKYDSAWEYHKALMSNFKDWQPPKKLVEVPQIVADFIEDKKEGLKLYGAFHEIEECYGPGTELYNWVFQKSNGQSLFARAWIDGYTVKKEKLYEVIINSLYLAKITKDSESKSHKFIEKDKLVNWQETGYRLTEKQIKAIDERYWVFAVEVDK